jgi:elongation factor P hydroxylase
MRPSKPSILFSWSLASGTSGKIQDFIGDPYSPKNLRKVEYRLFFQIQVTEKSFCWLYAVKSGYNDKGFLVMYPIQSEGGKIK